MGSNSALAEAPGASLNCPGEDEFLARARAAEPEALALIYATYYPQVYKFGVARLGDAYAAEDLASEVMVKVLESVSRFQFRGVAFSAWVFRIARNLVIDVRRKQRQRREIGLVDTLAVAQDGADRYVEQAFDRRRILFALNRLTPDQKRVMLLRYIEGHDNRSVGRMVGRSNSAVKSLQHRALHSMRRALLQSNGPYHTSSRRTARPG